MTDISTTFVLLYDVQQKTRTYEHVRVLDRAWWMVEGYPDLDLVHITHTRPEAKA